MLVFLVAAAIEGIYLSKLVKENAELRARGDADKRQIEAKYTKELSKHNTELRVLRVQNQDLLRLRTELRKLRPLTNDVASLQRQISKMAEGNPALEAITNTTALTSTNLAPPEIYLAKEDWAFAGYSNPDAAIESVIWAGSQGDLDTFLASLTADGRAKLEEQAQKQNKTPQDMVSDLKQAFTQFTGFKVTEQTILPDDSVMMRVFLDGANVTERFFFKKIGDEWKMSDSKSDK